MNIAIGSILNWIKEIVSKADNTITGDGENPHEDGTLGSIEWKQRRKIPLTEDEQAAVDELQKTIAAMYRLVHPRAAYFRRTQELLADELPDSIMEDIRGTPVSQAGEKIQLWLEVANFGWARTSAVMSRRAVIISAIALVVSSLAFLLSAITVGYQIVSSLPPC